MNPSVKWIGLGLGIPLLSLLLWYALIFDWNDLRDHLATAVGARTQRTFSVADVDVDLGLTSRIHLGRVRLANAPWSEHGPMVEMEALDFTLELPPLLRGRVVVPQLTLTRPHIVLERSHDGIPNWDFSAGPAGELAVDAAVPEERGEFPLIGRLLIIDGRLRYRDPVRGIELDSELATVLGQSPSASREVRLIGRGSFAERPFSLRFSGGSLLALREGDAPYPLELQADIGDTRIRVQGSARDPIGGEGLDLQMSLNGRDFAEIFPIFGIPLPPTRPYRLRGAIRHQGQHWAFRDFAGAIGDSDLAGNIEVDFAPSPPYLRAGLVSEQLQLSELAGFLGVRPDTDRSSDPHWIPDTPIPLQRLRAMDMDITFLAERVVAAQVPVQRVSYRLGLHGGRIEVAPLRFEIAEGSIAGSIGLDASAATPRLRADLGLQRLHLGRFLPDPEQLGVAYGVFGGRLELEGAGGNLRAILGEADGGIWLTMNGGAIDRLLLAAVDMDVPEVLTLLGAEKSPVALRCSVVAFDLRDGLMTSQAIVVDAAERTVFGRGSIDLATEALDLHLDARAKEPSMLNLGGSVTLGGTLRHPDVALDLSGAAGQAGTAVALGTLLGPLAAVLPFVDTGSAEDQPCGALFARARAAVE